MLAKESSERLLELIENGPVFVKAVLMRTKKSLEHLKTSVERYRKVFETLFPGIAGQKNLVAQVVSVFPPKNDDLRDKILKVI